MQLMTKNNALFLGALLLGASTASQAANETFDITVTTLPDVTLEELTPLDFGANMFVTAGGTCLMDAATPGNNSSENINMQYDGTLVSETNYGELSGTGCVAGETATPGLYRIDGVNGASVNITISSVTGTDFNFNPNSGCIVNYDGTAAADTCTSFIPNQVASRKLAGATEDAGTAGVRASTAGQLVFTIGGTITIGGADLSANTAYSEVFDVNVVY